MKLSPRLQAVADLVPPSRCVADIGTDHALLPLYLVEQGIVARVIAVEKEAGPAIVARRTVAARGLMDRIEVRVGDGLAPLRPGEAEIIVLAGLGGEKIATILAHGIETARTARQLVLQPMNRAAILRRWLAENAWRIAAETLVAEKKWLYQIITAAPGKEGQLSWLEAELGPCLLASHHPLLPELIRRLIIRYEQELAGLAQASGEQITARRAELRYRLSQLRALR
ncbi:tRNA (adenine(22)-N(1))-methyltransferase [Thermodesulfitimonas autotrophica]|uniref:tRNA (adenine(22)-N(1))-methyltransferase n=1 Tax=Thermodesulfitimonas autotrophica TaxID=1894989 RepID=UPI000F5122D1|nr:class I SAM-dependent methyltransferase [Thermodesulfitimonas autotrophica]